MSIKKTEKGILFIKTKNELRVYEPDYLPRLWSLQCFDKEIMKQKIKEFFKYRNSDKLKK